MILSIRDRAAVDCVEEGDWQTAKDLFRHAKRLHNLKFNHEGYRELTAPSNELVPPYRQISQPP
jgi:hypothetical protein